MSSVLQQPLQTAKLKSLPDDLRKLADELIADKFPGEVVRAEMPDPFLQTKRWVRHPSGYDTEEGVACIGYCCSPPVSSGWTDGGDFGHSGSDMASRDRSMVALSTHDISFRGIHDLLGEAKRRNIRMGDSRLLVHPMSWSNLRYQTEFNNFSIESTQPYNNKVVTKIFGIEVKVSDHITPGMIILESRGW